MLTPALLVWVHEQFWSQSSPVLSSVLVVFGWTPHQSCASWEHACTERLTVPSCWTEVLCPAAWRSLSCVSISAWGGGGHWHNQLVTLVAQACSAALPFPIAKRCLAPQHSFIRGIPGLSSSHMSAGAGGTKNSTGMGVRSRGFSVFPDMPLGLYCYFTCKPKVWVWGPGQSGNGSPMLTWCVHTQLEQCGAAFRQLFASPCLHAAVFQRPEWWGDPPVHSRCQCWFMAQPARLLSYAAANPLLPTSPSSSWSEDFSSEGMHWA